MSQTHTKPDRGPTYRTPRWVKMSAIIVIILILLLVILHLTGNNLGCPPPGGGHIPPGCPIETQSGDAGDTLLRTVVAIPTVEYWLQQL